MHFSVFLHTYLMQDAFGGYVGHRKVVRMYVHRWYFLQLSRKYFKN